MLATLLLAVTTYLENHLKGGSEGLILASPLKVLSFFPRKEYGEPMK